MKKFSILTLMIILIGALSVVGFAAVEDTAAADVSFSVTSVISLTIHGGSTVHFWDVTPGSYHEEVDANHLKVRAANDLSWSITKSKSSNTVDDLSILQVTPEITSGTGSNNNIPVDYALDVPWDIDTGNHTIIVTYTISA